MGRPSEIDQVEFCKLWRAGVRTVEMADFFDITPNAVTAAARRFGLPRRRQGGVAPSGPSVEDVIEVASLPVRVAPIKVSASRIDAIRQAKAEEAKARCGVSGSPVWSKDRDAAVIEAAGRYAVLAELAQGWGLSCQSVVARWHVLRVSR